MEKIIITNAQNISLLYVFSRCVNLPTLFKCSSGNGAYQNDDDDDGCGMKSCSEILSTLVNPYFPVIF